MTGVNQVCLTASVTEEEAAARIRAMMGDRSTDAIRQSRLWLHYATKTCSHCVACKAPFQAGQAVFRDKRYQERRVRIGPVCADCRSKYAKFDLGEACEGCGRPVLNRLDARNRRTFCSDLCGARTYSRVKHAKKVAERGTRECLECAEVFEPTRADARFCSPACKQKNYRHRVTDRISLFDDTNHTRNEEPSSLGEHDISAKPLKAKAPPLANASNLPQQNGGASGQL